MRNEVRAATAWVKWRVLWVSSQSGLLAMAGKHRHVGGMADQVAAGEDRFF